MPLLQLPEPYDFELSTARYRAFGPDRANLWHEGALHRVVDGRDVRIAAAPGGVEVEPLDGDIEPVVRTLLGTDFDLAPFYEFARGDSILGDLVERFAGLRPPLNPDPFETLVTSITAQQVSLHAAVSIRNRLIERYGEPGAVAYAFPTRAALAEAREDELAALGFSRRKAPRRRGEGHARRRSRPGGVDGGLVPRPAPRPPARVAGRRPRRAEGGVALLW